MELQIRGLRALNRRLAQVAKEFPEAGMTALREIAEEEMTEAKRRTPVDTGALRASGHVVSDEERLAVSLRFGGPSIPYAIYVHEDIDAHHPVGQAKFLESVILESMPHLPTRLAARIRRITGA